MSHSSAPTRRGRSSGGLTPRRHVVTHFGNDTKKIVKNGEWPLAVGKSWPKFSFEMNFEFEQAK